jgi:hypothetical protein
VFSHSPSAGLAMVLRSPWIMVSASATTQVPLLEHTLIILANFRIFFVHWRKFHLKQTKIAFLKNLLNPPLFHLYQQVREQK